MQRRNLNRREFLRCAGAGAAAAGLGVAGVAGAQGGGKKPNVLFFLIDDLGWMDTTPYGSMFYETPNIERLAKRSMRFTDAYAANPLCSPTRASLMTGKYPARLHFTAPAGHMPAQDGPLMPESAPPNVKVLMPESMRYLPLEERTIGEAMKDGGYKTGFIGKWHMGHDEKYWPEYQGFDLNIGGGRWPGPPSYFSPYHISNLPDGPEGEYIADRLTDEAETFIKNRGGDPFFLCFWHYSVHAPYQGKEEYREYFTTQKDPRSAQDNDVMAAMIKSLDDSIGRMLDLLEAEGIADDTIIIFFSDNGGNMYDRTAPDGTNLGAQAPDGRKPTNNAPLRSGKGSIYEGGIRVPMFVAWPGVVEPGSVSDALVSSVDLYPTILEMAGLQPEPDKILDGLSLAPVLKAQRDLEREAIFVHFPHAPVAVPCQMSTAVRQGRWKLIRFYEQDENFPNEYELYDLQTDIGEVNNLAEKMPEKVKELAALMDQHLEEVDAHVPKPNPNYNADALLEVQGWRPSGNATLELRDGFLRMTAHGSDQWLINNAPPAAEGPMTFIARVRTSNTGDGEFFWLTEQMPNFRPPHPLKVNFPMQHGGQWREYRVELKADAPLTGLRIDLGQTAGTVDVDWFELRDNTGNIIKYWSFGK